MNMRGPLQGGTTVSLQVMVYCRQQEQAHSIAQETDPAESSVRGGVRPHTLFSAVPLGLGADLTGPDWSGSQLLGGNTATLVVSACLTQLLSLCKRGAWLM